MLRLLLLGSLLQIVYGSCPSQLLLYRDGQCRGYYRGGSYYMNQLLGLAISYCNEIRAFPVSIHNDEQQGYWTGRHQNGPDFLTVIGLTCNTNSHDWEWADGTPVDFKPPSGKYSAELDGGCSAGCTWYLTNDGSWEIDCTSNDRSFDLYCIAQLEQPIASTDCGNFNDDSDDSQCFEIATNGENFKDAQAICHSFGAEVASVHSQQENSYIRRFAVSRGATNGVLLGATLTGKGDDFGWVDGSDWDYTNFHPGFPISGLGDCLTMDTITTSGQWMNTDCGAKMPAVCSRPLHVTPEQDGCSSGPWKEGQIIYSPGFPNDASVPCEYFLTVPTGERVRLEILMLEANSCCDYLMITDGYVGGTIMANLTGEVSETTYITSTNIARVIWQPDGGVNVRGVMMTFSTY